MAKNLRTYLEQLEKERPEVILRVKKPMKVAYEISALQRKLDALRKYPVIIVEHPILDNGTESAFPVVTNLTASRELCADALGLDHRRIAMDYAQKVSNRIDPVKVSKEEAPVKEVIETGDQINLLKFPILTHNYMDPGPYIGTGFVCNYDPETKIDNCSLQRIWVKSPRRTGYWPAVTSHSMQNIWKWWGQGKDMPVAIWIGHHPAGISGAQSRLAYPESHYPSMGGVMGEAVKLVPSELFGEDIMVPADAEMVIEGYVPREVFEAEGPFGEYPGYIGPQRPSPVIDVKCVTYRKDAIYHGLGVGLADHLVLLGNFPLEARIYNVVKSVVPEVMNVFVPISGRRNHVYVQVKKTRPGIGKEVIMATLPCDSRLKHVFVIDEDMDLFNESDIMWSIAYRSQWDRDLVVVEGAAVFPLDPSVPSPGNIGTRGGIDATMPPPIGNGLPRFYQMVNKTPEDVAAAIQLEDFVDPSLLSNYPTSS
ncbi:MAG: UbiD family decarboxylase [Desulfarculus sp.]|nr:UbiD family decarboxylase [Pseudomonadota bacterium]MBV1718028.1 UbiD family decarboxylase [Desulfarculus sp.]MBU4575547.1 UbiD family decarboxylase [Pseudomonadota bacterium]MBU4597533.1 UbiD family decarboxylase [Pseudomonadota bacterium]MBV1739267.1 UbiD family decarboxylase [Desulfarculus sp.]